MTRIGAKGFRFPITWRAPASTVFLPPPCSFVSSVVKGFWGFRSRAMSAMQISGAAQNRGPRRARSWLGGVEIRRASTCHRERAAKPGVERSKSAKPNLWPSACVLQPDTPTPSFFNSLLQTKDFCKSTLGWPLRGPWVTLGWPLGHPRATQSQSQSQSAEGRKQLLALPKG
jgi:hypothetical protein